MANRLRVLAEPTRIELMRILDDGGEATVQSLSARLATTYQNTSKHLVVLYQAGLVSRRREGNYMFYALADWTALWLVEQVTTSLLEQLEQQQRRLLGE